MGTGILRKQIKALVVLVIGGLLGLSLVTVRIAHGAVGCPDDLYDVGEFQFIANYPGVGDITHDVLGFADGIADVSVRYPVMYTYINGSADGYPGWNLDGSVEWKFAMCHGCDSDSSHVTVVAYLEGGGGIHDCEGGTFPEPETEDTDEDGIPDEVDPYPDNGDPFMFDITYEVRDENGDLQYWCMKTDKGDWFCYGDGDYAQDCFDGLNNCETKSYLTIGGSSYPYSGSQLSALGNGYDLPLSSDAVAKNVLTENGERVVTESSGVQSGVTSTGTETDNEALHKIVDNTGVQIENQKRIADYLKGMDQGLMNMENKLENIEGKIGTESLTGIYEGPSAVDIAGAIDANNQADGTEAETYAQNQLDGITDPEFNGEFTQEDVPEEDSLGGIWDSFLSSNPISTAINGSGLTTDSSMCSMSFEYQGEQVELSMCDWQDELNQWGAILLAVTGLISVVIVVKG